MRAAAPCLDDEDGSRNERGEKADHQRDRDRRAEHRAEQERELHVAHPEPLRVREDDEEERAGGDERPHEPRGARVDRRVRDERDRRSGRTIRFGTMRCRTSITESVTSTAQKPAASAASGGRAEDGDAGDDERAVTSLDQRVERRDRASQCRQRPRSRRYDSTGMLSRQRISVAQVPHDDGGRRIDRRAGTRATTTFRKLPSASAGARTKAAAAAFMAS